MDLAQRPVSEIFLDLKGLLQEGIETEFVQLETRVGMIPGDSGHPFKSLRPGRDPLPKQLQNSLSGPRTDEECLKIKVRRGQ